MLPLAYNSNVHPAETCAEVMTAMRDFALPVRQALTWDSLGVDLRLGSVAIAELRSERARGRLRRCIDDCQVQVYTINGFPLAPFQSRVVKEQAYHPDWTTRQRLDDTLTLIDCALALSDESVVSISTAPGTFKPWGYGQDRIQQIAEHLGVWLAAAAMRQRETGRRVQLAIEPEPWCLLEYSHEVVAFWQGPVQRWAVPMCARALDNDSAAAQQAVRDHLAVCFDTCHVSVAFEDQCAAVQRFVDAGISIAKCQFSAALEVRHPAQQPAAVAALAAMDEPRFLHQTAAATANGSSVRVQDLSELAQCLEHLPTAEAVRSHFHIPVFRAASDEGLSSTIGESIEGLHACVAAGVRHIAVETYTWSILEDMDDDYTAMTGTIRELEFLHNLTHNITHNITHNLHVKEGL